MADIKYEKVSDTEIKEISTDEVIHTLDDLNARIEQVIGNLALIDVDYASRKSALLQQLSDIKAIFDSVGIVVPDTLSTALEPPIKETVP